MSFDNNYFILYKLELSETLLQKFGGVKQDNLAMVVIPAGVFVELGNAIKEQSQFEITIVVYHANGHNE